MTVDSQTFKETLALWGTGISVVTTVSEGVYHGMTANTFTSVSLTPLLVLVCIDHTAQAYHYMKNSGIFAVNILNTDQLYWGQRFAGFFPEIVDRFEGIAFTTAVTGAPILPGVLGWVDCRVYQMHEAGDHTIFVGEVIAAAAYGGANPLMYFNRTWGQFAPLPLEHS